MKKREKIGILIFFILATIWAIIFWNATKTDNSKVGVNCNTACHKFGNMGWAFAHAGSISKNIFPTQEACVSACQAKFPK